MQRPLVLLYALCALFTWARAETPRVGAVLSLSGADEHTGNAQAAALELAARDLAARGLRLELRVLDDRSDPQRAAEHAAALLAEGAHALVCCSSPEVADAVRAAFDADAPPTFALSHPRGAGAPTRGFFSLEPGSAYELAELARHLAAQARVALLAPYSPAGDTAEAVLRARLGERLVGSERYPVASGDPLTPEALLAITRLPDAVVVWGERAGEALTALAARGYTGPVYLEARALEGLSALQRARLEGAALEARAVVSPFVLGFALAAEHPSAAQSARYRRASALSGGESSLAGAYAWDALQLLGGAFEQAYAYGLTSGAARGEDQRARLRAALREVLFGLEPVAGSSAVLQPSAQRLGVAVSGALVAARWQGGAWRPLGAPTAP
ncbi:ABC transporter substrate-binding protein [Truepera radiovictrix]|uniref:ABC-type branched-chain amino acid transport systems periplasmic component n=1 Tax=Truepera radiovictrix (strain DSM 17093 / CIP 108686 / LMG 22925 / RQ-24) TaxID=649638 RepID=D7CTC5_TRURR|nr:ABC transporter substrate-binding protein [Truepera radiovictrix]ADI13782.1 ABC-type branched-chain amino acid transport systems periplasmic component [Truepera radiovictrix DSM 17093]WMT57652.1 ABC transporter substrate-binding protein [Truepera radiovictrix]